MLLIVQIILFTLTLKWVRAEIHRAVVELEPLLATHRSVICSLESYLDEENKRLEGLKRYLVQYKNEHKTMEEDGWKYIYNPVYSLIVIKRLTADLDSIERLVINSAFNKQPEAVFPTSEDLEAAVLALSRLQTMYDLNATQLADGELYGTFSHDKIPFKEQTFPMSATDCFHIGRVLCDNEDYGNAVQWLLLALHRSKHQPQEFINFSEASLVDYIRCANHGLTSTTKQNYNNDLNDQESKTYKELCQDERRLPHDIAKSLHCYYKSGPESFLFLARIKTELLYLEPAVLMFHDVISDAENDAIQTLARPQLQTSGVRSNLKMYRISKGSWLNDHVSPVVARVSQRVADFTELSVLTAEQLQVVNYGIGGHYKPHHDTFPMTDVEQGGATVFTSLNLTVFPTKNSAIFWFNMHASGDADDRLRHAACPVLRGSKWVFTKWLHYGGQEFHRPCDLSNNTKNNN